MAEGTVNSGSSDLGRGSKDRLKCEFGRQGDLGESRLAAAGGTRVTVTLDEK